MKVRFDLLGKKATLSQSKDKAKCGTRTNVNLDYDGKRIILATLKDIDSTFSIKLLYSVFYVFSADVCDWAFNGKNEKEVADYLGTDENIKEIKGNYEKFITLFPDNVETISMVNDVASRLYDKVYN